MFLKTNVCKICHNSIKMKINLVLSLTISIKLIEWIIFLIIIYYIMLN